MDVAGVGVGRAKAILLASLLLLFGFRPHAAAETASSRNELIETHRCLLAASLRAVYERPSAFKERDRFLVLSEKARPQAYVQCMFADNREKLY